MILSEMTRSDVPILRGLGVARPDGARHSDHPYIAGGDAAAHQAAVVALTASRAQPRTRATRATICRELGI